MLEAQALQEDLRRASIEPFAWVVNASLAAAQPRDALLAQRAIAELDEIRRVRDVLAHRFAVVGGSLDAGQCRVGKLGV